MNLMLGHMYALHRLHLTGPIVGDPVRAAKSKTGGSCSVPIVSAIGDIWNFNFRTLSWGRRSEGAQGCNIVGSIPNLENEIFNIFISSLWKPVKAQRWVLLHITSPYTRPQGFGKWGTKLSKWEMEYVYTRFPGTLCLLCYVRDTKWSKQTIDIKWSLFDYFKCICIYLFF